MEDRGRSTKWGGKSARFVDFTGQKLDTIITGHLTQEQVNAYQQYFRIEEISHTFRKAVASGTSISHVLPSHNVERFRRDPSPPPRYDNAGNRTNTRDQRIRSSLEKEIHTLVELAATSIKHYDPPVDYTKPAKTSEKLYIPIKDYPDINFVGLLLGPRGNTLRQLQEDSGAKLAIRGKGSVKDGKSMDSTGQSSPEDNLHVVITADTTAKILKAINLTNEVLEKAISSPVGQNDLKRDQLRELAVLNGTLRETKPYVAPELFNAQRRLQTRDITQIMCRICGNVGHYSRDCKMRNEQNSVDSYSPGSGNSNGEAAAGHSHLHHNRPPVEDVSPWKRARTEQTLNQATPPWISQPNQGNHYASSAYTSGHTGHQAYRSSAYSSNFGRPGSSQQYPQRANHHLPPQIPPIPGHNTLNHNTGNGFYKQAYSSNIPAQVSAVPPPTLVSAHIQHTERAPPGPPPTLENIARVTMGARPPPPPPPSAGVVLPAPPAAPAQGLSSRPPPPPPPPPKSRSLGGSGPKAPPPPPPLG